MEILIFVLLLWLVPVAIVIGMARSKGRSKHFAWWPVLLGWLGFAVAAVMICAGASRKEGDGS